MTATPPSESPASEQPPAETKKTRKLKPVVLWTDKRHRRVKIPADIVEAGFVMFQDHELLIDPDEMGVDKAQALLDLLVKHGYGTKPTEAKARKPSF